MGYTYVDYDLLAKFIRESIDTELKSYGLDPRKLIKALKALSKDHPDRAMQCRYLLVILKCLDNSED
ncbi:MAG: hypothetical protein HYX60_10540, partial [Legionella longbeachae]|nr:hypothetical protein [Legionella longbeachae]